MTSVSEKQVVDFLEDLSTMEPDAVAVAALTDRGRTVGRRRHRGRSVRRVAALSLAIVAGSSALAAATGLWAENPDPIPPARVVESSVPAAVVDTVSVFDRGVATGDRSPGARAAIGAIRSPFVIDAGSVRSVGSTPLGESAYVAFARTDLDALPPQLREHEPPGGTQGVYVAVSGPFGGVGADGPFPLEDIARGAAWGIKEIPSSVPVQAGDGRMFTAVVPDRVAEVELRFRDGSRETHAVNGNVVLAQVEAGPTTEGLETLRWISSDGSTLRTFRF
jgi:hypothetical protein